MHIAISIVIFVYCAFEVFMFNPSLYTHSDYLLFWLMSMLINISLWLHNGIKKVKE